MSYTKTPCQDVSKEGKIEFAYSFLLLKGNVGKGFINKAFFEVAAFQMDPEVQMECLQAKMGDKDTHTNIFEVNE